MNNRRVPKYLTGWGLRSAASLLNYFLFAITQTNFGCLLIPSSLFFLPQQMSASPSVCFTYAIILWSHIAAQNHIYLFFLRLPPLQRLVSCYTFLSASFPPLYICYSLHPTIRILLTLACLIRVRQGKIKTKASPFFPPLPSTCPLPLSSASSFLPHSPFPCTPVSWITGR